ncbi:MAG TPA: alpha-L-arabinofuranosidase C-terminal domain-containing protein, partial [Propionibacteriaceae bacterium]
SEEAYTVADAVVVGSLLITLLRHSDRVTSACVAQLVNTISMIRSEPGGPAWRQSIFHPFALTARHAVGEVLIAQVDSPTYSTASYGEVPLVDATATRDPETGETTIFAVNRHQSEPLVLEVNVRGLSGVRVSEAWTLADADPLAANTEAEPDRVVPRPVEATATDGVLRVELPAVSWSCVRLASA